MGTRSLTRFIEIWPGHDERAIGAMYRQFDGYVSGHGRDLANFLNGMHLVNGLSAGQPERKANGVGCLGAQVIAHFKAAQDTGSIYLAAVEDDQEYTYEVRGYMRDFRAKPDDEAEARLSGEYGIQIRVIAHEERIFDGTAAELLNFTEAGA